MEVLLLLVIGWSFYAGVAMLLVCLLLLVPRPARARRMLKLGGWGAVLVVASIWLGAHLMAVLQPGSAWGSLAGRYADTFMSFSGAGFTLGALWGLASAR